MSSEGYKLLENTAHMPKNWTPHAEDLLTQRVTPTSQDMKVKSQG